MRRHLILAVACALLATPALAIDIPTRKPGLWELTTTFGQPKLAGHVIRQCTDAATDKLMNSNFGGTAQQNCAKQEMHKTGGTIVVNSVCTFAGMTTQSHAVITGSFDSAYKMEVTTKHVSGPVRRAFLSGDRHMAIVAKWIGPCAKGQRPGDVMMGNGMKMNVLDLQKKQGSPPAQKSGALASADAVAREQLAHGRRPGLLP